MTPWSGRGTLQFRPKRFSRRNREVLLEVLNDEEDAFTICRYDDDEVLRD